MVGINVWSLSDFMLDVQYLWCSMHGNIVSFHQNSSERWNFRISGIRWASDEVKMASGTGAILKTEYFVICVISKYILTVHLFYMILGEFAMPWPKNWYATGTYKVALGIFHTNHQSYHSDIILKYFLKLVMNVQEIAKPYAKSIP